MGYSSQDLGHYSKEIGLIPLLSKEEELELARQAKAGDTQAYDALVTSHLRFVVRVANQFTNRGLELEDLVQEGNLGLIKAVYKFEEDRGLRFLSYAVWWIRQSIQKALADNSRTVRLPQYKHRIYNQVTGKKIRLTRELQREPMDEEVASAMGLSLEDYQKLTSSIPRFVYLDQVLGDDKFVYLDQDLGDDKLDGSLCAHISLETKEEIETKLFLSMERENLGGLVQSSLEKLTPRERDIITRYFGLDGNESETLKKIGERYGVTKEGIWQIKKKALDRLRKREGYKALRQGYTEL